MPRSWLTVRPPKEPKDVLNVTPDQFDFEFVTCSQEFDLPYSPVKNRANMFNGSAFRSKRYKNNALGSHPPNGNNFAVDKRLQLTKVEDNWIGVAFGSPTHPPTSIPGFTNYESMSPPKHAFRNEGPLPASPVGFAKCRKFSNLFKSRSGQIAISAPTKVYRLDGDQKLGMPIARKPLHHTDSLPEWVNSENPEAFTPTLPEEPRMSSDDEAPLPPLKFKRTSLPRLEIQIPHVEMDRYSVMFSGVAGIKPSSLLERRSRNLSKLAIQVDPEVPPVPPLKSLQPRRPVTPPTHHRRKSSTYSLFPSPPKPKAREGDAVERQLPSRKLSFSKRDASSDNPLTLISDKEITKIETHCVTPERKEPESFFLSPDDTVASSERDDSPWRSSASLDSVPSSRTSVESEIFFDVKPARDSHGRENSQYIIQKPDSSSVELALSSKSRRSRRAKSRRQHDDDGSGFDITPDLWSAGSTETTEEKWRLSLELNQAILEVEKLTSPFSSIMPPVKVSDVVGMYPSQASKELLPSIKLRKRFDGLAIGIPSPITERSEEFSPRPDPLETVIRSRPRPHIASLSVRPTLLSMAIDSLSPTIEDFAITPPPVPVKDAKFIPMSKYAGAGAAVKLVDHRPKRRKPRRSVTDDRIIRKKSSSMAVPLRASSERERPLTVSSSLPHSQSTQELIGASTTRATESKILAATATPSAEVSVARKVSLARKHSHKISVSSPKTRAAESMQNLMLTPIEDETPVFREGETSHKPGSSFSSLAETIVAR